MSLADLETPKAGRNLRELKDGAPIICKDDEEDDCDMLTALIGCGAREVFEDPRDTGALNCLFSVLSYILGGGAKQQFTGTGIEQKRLVKYSRQCLMRCLEIGDQGHSTGMTGWVDHEQSGPLCRIVAETPFALLHRLACSHVREGKWNSAERILRSLVLRSEQQLPLYHPTVLVSLLDLAALCSINGNVLFAEALVSRASERLTAYLTEMESAHMGHLDQCASVNSNVGGDLCQLDNGRDAFSMLSAFVENFQVLLQREMVALLGEDDEYVLAYRLLLGDSLVVLANCTSASNMSFGRTDTDVTAKKALSFWGLAFVHYRSAFQGFVARKGLEDPNTACAAYGSARCLRELGKSEQALTVLSTVAKVLFDGAVTKSDDQAVKAGKKRTGDQERGQRHSFLPSTTLSHTKTYHHRREIRQLRSSSMCYWLMAVLIAESQPNEGGRVKALKFLQRASVSLQRALGFSASSNDESSRATCVDWLRKIEDEAKSILQPMRPQVMRNPAYTRTTARRLTAKA